MNAVVETPMPRTGRPRLKHKRSAPIKTLDYPENAKAFAHACGVTKIDQPDVLRELAAKWVEYVAENPRATLRFKIVEDLGPG